MAKRVTTIPATLNRFDSTPLNDFRKRRVAGYARVILSILVDTFISKISLTMQPGPKIDSISGA